MHKLERFRFLLSSSLLFALPFLAVSAHAGDGPLKAYGQQSSETIVINEIMPSNLDMFLDRSGDFGGFIEIYNPSDNPVRLLNLYISDDASNLQKYQLGASAGVVPAHGFCTVWFDHNGAEGDFLIGAAAQVPWKLDYDGGEIFLTTKNGEMIASQKYPKAVSRVSWARKTDGGEEWGYTAEPTPGGSNEGSVFAATQIAAPEPTVEGSLFSEAFSFRVTFPEGSTLMYTTDGSTPTLTNGSKSTVGAFRVSTGKSNIYRFRAFKDGYLPSEVVTRSFIYKNKDYSLPMVSIVTDPKNLYGDSIGIFVSGHFSNHNKDWDRPVNFEFFRDDECLLNTECDIACSGAFSRNSTPRPFRLKASKLYSGRNSFDAHFFDAKKFLKTKSLKFRNGGNDVDTRLKDGAVQEIIQRSGFYLDGQLCQPVHVFVNGAYHGMLNIREPSNKFFAYSNYGLDTDNLDVFEYNPGTGYYQKEGDNEMFLKFFNLTYDAADDAAYEEICRIVDIDEYCNYMAAQCWLGGNDWVPNNNNAKGFRERSEDGRFHFVMYDVDAVFATTDLFSEMQKKVDNQNFIGGKNYLIQSLFNLVENPAFKKKFTTAYCLVGGSVFEPTRSAAIVNEMAENSALALALEGKSNRAQADDIINQISRSSKRDARLNSLSRFLSLGSNHMMKFYSTLPEARFLLNGEFVPTAKFDGKLYGGQTMEVFAPAGYNFVGWRRLTDNKIVSTKRKFNYSSISFSEIAADFEPVPEEELMNAGAFPVVVNEVGASNSVFCNEFFKRNDWVELYNNTGEAVDVDGMYLSDNKDNLFKYQIKASESVNTVIPPHGHLVVWCDKVEAESFVHASFKLANADNEYVFLTAADGSWTDRFRYMAHPGNHSFGRFPDGGRCVYEMTRPTIGESNQMTTQSVLAYGTNDDHEPGVDDRIDGTELPVAGDCKFYSPSGILLQEPRHGVNILRTTDGRIKKVVVK